MAACEAVDAAFVTDAPFGFLNTVDLPAPPARVFAVLADVGSWARWFDGMKGVEALVDTPQGVGWRRRARLDAITVDETFLVWEPGRRFTFRADAVSLPIVDALAEDWRVDAAPGGSRLVWRVGYRPTWLGRAIHWPLRAVFQRQFKASLDGLARYLAAGS